MDGFPETLQFVEWDASTRSDGHESPIVVGIGGLNGGKLTEDMATSYGRVIPNLMRAIHLLLTHACTIMPY